MNNEELKYPEWQRPLQEVILEFDRTKLPEKLQKVETLIFDRAQQLRQTNHGQIETQALDDALVVLRVIKREKLDFPDLEHVEMDFQCPECGRKMILLVGLNADASHNELTCPDCGQTVVALVPGPIVGGPFRPEI